MESIDLFRSPEAHAAFLANFKCYNCERAAAVGGCARIMQLALCCACRMCVCDSPHHTVRTCTCKYILYADARMKHNIHKSHATPRRRQPRGEGAARRRHHYNKVAHAGPRLTRCVGQARVWLAQPAAFAVPYSCRCGACPLPARMPACAPRLRTTPVTHTQTQAHAAAHRERDCDG